MIRRTSNQSAIGEVIKTIIETNKWQPGIDAVNVKEAWKNLMGNGVNSYTKNVVLKGGTLYVELSSSVLREELSLGKTKIKAMINQELSREVVKEVVLR